MNPEPPKIVITSGEPAGIGVDICLSLAEFQRSVPDVQLYIIADPALVEQRAGQLHRDIDILIHHDLDTLSDRFDGQRLNIIPVGLKSPCETGVLDVSNSTYVLQMLDLAIDLCSRRIADAMVTGPVHKHIIESCGITFTGHTEYLAEKSSSIPVMMLATDSMRVALATTHLPLSQVSDAITEDSLTQTITILNDFLREQAGIASPKILVCGLNPHAGEDGSLGDEEIRIIKPVLATLARQGIDLVGPLPADTLFTAKYLDHADAVLAMYHDQGLPVLKFSGFGKAVNITLGLPFVRTSVDHGTALDLAGTGQADANSLHEAIRMAIRYSDVRDDIHH